VLVRTGVISLEKMKQVRHYVLVGAFVIGAIFTPPDVVSQFLLAIPLYLLYELGIFLAGLSSKPANPTNPASDQQFINNANRPAIKVKDD
jgi:sec-independent protein translocase protein TatC